MNLFPIRDMNLSATVLYRTPLILNPQVFADVIMEHGDERCLVTIAHDNWGSRKRKPTGFMCANCMEGHLEHCTMPKTCDCLCHK
jgi:hypothetical protein